MKYITRFGKTGKSFKGWRVSICRQHVQFTRYFSDREFVNSDASLREALRIRNLILRDLAKGELSPTEIFNYYSKIQARSLYPQGLRPIRAQR